MTDYSHTTKKVEILHHFILMPIETVFGFCSNWEYRTREQYGKDGDSYLLDDVVYVDSTKIPLG